MDSEYTSASGFTMVLTPANDALSAVIDPFGAERPGIVVGVDVGDEALELLLDGLGVAPEEGCREGGEVAAGGAEALLHPSAEGGGIDIEVVEGLAEPARSGEEEHLDARTIHDLPDEVRLIDVLELGLAHGAARFASNQFAQGTFVSPLVAAGKSLSHFTMFPVVLFVISMPHVSITASLLLPENVLSLPEPSSV